MIGRRRTTGETATKRCLGGRSSAIAFKGIAEGRDALRSGDAFTVTAACGDKNDWRTFKPAE